MIRLIFGLLTFIIGVVLGVVMLYYVLTGQTHDGGMLTRFRALIVPAVLIVCGITWMRGQTFHTQ